MITKSNLVNQLDNSTNKKGFTLIELLAVIIILAVISLIAVPIIINTIENARKKAFKNSVILTSREIDNYMIKNDDFNYKEGDEVTVEQLRKVVKHGFKGGKYKIVNGIVEAYFITDGKYCAKGTMTELEINKDCYKLDDTKAKIDMDKLKIKSYPNSVVVTLDNGFAQDLESGIREYRVTLYDGENKVEKQSTEETDKKAEFSFNNLEELKEYRIIIAVENGNGIVTTIPVSLSKPSYQVDKNGWAQSKKLDIIYPEKGEEYKKEYSYNAGAPDEEWKEYEGEITITKNGTITARIQNGTTYITGSSYNITTIDISEPTVSILDEVTSKSITVTAIGADEQSKIYGYQFKIDNNNWSEIETVTLANQQKEYTFSNLTKGSHTIYVKAINNTYPNEELNNQNTCIREKEIDTEEPQKPTYSISPNGWAQSKTVTINFNDETGTYKHYYQKDGGEWQLVNGNTVDVEFTTNGTVLAKLNDDVNDFEGYENGSSYGVTSIDNSHPTDVEFTYIRTSNSIRIKASAEDKESNIYGYQFSNDNGSIWTEIQGSDEYTFDNLTTDTYRVKVKAINGTYTNVNTVNANNSYDSDMEEITTLTITAPNYIPDKTGWQQSKTITVNYNDEAGTYKHYYQKDGGEWQLVNGNTVDVEFTTNGTLLAKVTDGTNDVTGYENGSSYNVTEIDTEAPEVTFGTNGNDTAAKSQSTIVTVTDNNVDTIKTIKYVWSINDGASAQEGTTFTSGQEITKNAVNGTYYLCIYAEDKAGNVTETCSNAFKLDNQAPTVSFGTNGNSTAAKSQSSTITVTNDSYGANLDTSSYKYVWSTSNTENPTETFTSGTSYSKDTVNGTYYLRATACDSLGNCTTETSNAFKLDNQGPTVSFGTNGNNTAAKSQSSTITVTNDSYGASLDTSSYKYVWSTSNTATPSTTFTSGTSYSKDTVNGTYYLRATACDSLGNCTTETSNAFKLDNQGPTVSFGTNGNSTYKASQSSTITVTNDSYGASLNTSSYKYIWSTSNTATPSTAFSSGSSYSQSSGTGTYYLRATACDNLGNCITSTSNAFKLDNTEPSLSVGTVSSDTTSITINYTASDNHSQLASVVCYYGTSTSYGSSVTGSNGKCSITGLKYNTTYYYKVVATDNATKTSQATGSKATTKSSTIYVKSNGSDTASCGTSSAPCATLAQAVSVVASGGTVKLLSNLTATSVATVSSKTVSITSNSGTYTITRGSSFTNNYIINASASTVTLTNIMIDGANVTSTTPIIYVGNSSTMNINSGTTVKRSISTNSWSPGAILVSSSTLNITSATISNNKANASSNQGAGGAIRVDNGTLTINSGTISNNSCTEGGGAIYLYDKSTLNLKGGTISYNSTPSHAGGGIKAIKSSTITMSGGTVDSNDPNGGWAGGFYIENSTFTMTSGTISNNKGLYGGGIFSNSSTLYLKGGNIKNNSASARGGGISADYSTVYVQGVTISGNTATSDCSAIDASTGSTYSKTSGTVSGTVCQ